MDKQVCREHLAKLLAEETAALERLAQFLEREHKLLVENDVQELEIAVRKRQDCVGVVVRIEDERRSLCRMLGYPTDVQGLTQLLHWCDPTHTLAAPLKEFSVLTTRCREFNDRNGILVNARLTRVQALLGVLTGHAAASRTYGPRAALSIPRIGRVLTVEA